MPGATQEDARKTPVEMALGSLLPLPPAASGALVSVLSLAVFCGYQILMGNPIMDPVRGGLYVATNSALGIAVTGGYVLAATWSVSRAVRRELKAFGVDVGDPILADLDLARDDFGAGAVVVSRYVGGAAVVLAVSIVAALDALVDMGWAAGVEASFAMTLLLVWICARSSFFTLADATDTRGVEIELDVLSLGALDCYGRIGLRLSLAWIAGVSIFVLMSFLFPILNEGAWYTVAVPVFGVSLLVATLALLLPARRARRQIRRIKRVALQEIDDAVFVAREAVVRNDLHEYGRLSDLLTYRTFVEGVREWPFDAGTLMRFSFYTLIPVGSWLGGAFVERIVDAALN